MDQKKYDVVCLGSCTMDLIFQVEDIMRMELTDRDNIVKKYVAIENSSKLNVQQVKFYPGGSAANIACLGILKEDKYSANPIKSWPKK